MEALKIFEAQEWWWQGIMSIFMGIAFGLMLINDQYTILPLIVILAWIGHAVTAYPFLLRYRFSQSEIQGSRHYRRRTIQLSILWGALLIISLAAAKPLNVRLGLLLNPATGGLFVGVITFCGLRLINRLLIYLLVKIT